MENAPAPEREPTDLEARLEGWLSLGLVSAEQVDGIRRAEGLPVPADTGASADEASDHGRAGSLLAEALGYFGGVLVLVALFLLGAQTWKELGTLVRLGLLGLATAAFLVAGVLTPIRRPDGSRLRAVLWALSVAAAAGLLTVLGMRVLDLHDVSLALLVTGGCLLLATSLWWRHRVALLQAASLAAAAATLAALVQLWADASAAASGVPVWVLGWCWLALGRRGHLPPPRAATLLGPAAVIGACFALSTDDAGRFVVLLTLVVLGALAVHWRDLWLLGVSAAGSLLLLPGMVAHWFPGRFAASAALLAGGVLLLVAAVHIATGTKRLA